QAAGDVADGRAALGRRPARLSGDAHHAAERLHDQVVGRLATPRPRLPKAGGRRVDQTGIFYLQSLVAEAQPFERTGPEVLNQHVGAADHAPQQGTVGVALEVERDALLAAVERHEISRLLPEERREAARVVAPVGVLNLDDARAEFGEQHRAVRPGEDARQV